MKKVIIFDFNGTLIDDCDCCLKILNILCEKYNIPSVSKRKYKEIFTFPVSNYYKALGFDVEHDFSKIGGEFHSYYNVNSYEEVKLFKDVIEILEFLKSDYILVCLSASMQSTLEKQLKFYNIYSYFDYIVGLGDSNAVSKEEVAKSFMINHKEFKQEECLLIGDSIHDYEVATSICVDCYLVATGHTAKHRLLKTTTNVINSLTDIKKII